MAMSDAERQQLCRARQRADKEMGLDLGDDLEDKTPIKKGQMTPLEYMLDVMNDPNVDKSRRDRMAQAAAPYVHGKVETIGPKTKKEEKEAAAEDASEGKFAPANPPPLPNNHITTH